MQLIGWINNVMIMKMNVWNSVVILLSRKIRLVVCLFLGK